MKNYDENAFVAVLLLCVAALFCSCRTTRQSVETIEVESCDTVRAELRDDTSTVCNAHRESMSDSVWQTVCSEGTLEIKRDSSGLPVVYRWSTVDHGRFVRDWLWDCNDALFRSSASYAVSSSSRSQESAEKKETTVAKAGVSLTEYVGTGLLIAVIIYVIFIIAEHLWRNRKK